MNGMPQKSILLVEDEVLISMSEKMQLEKYGYRVITANTGEKAVDTCKESFAIDLILMDIDLGSGIDGTEAAQLILNDRDVPIVFVSSHTEPEIVEKTEKITSYGYVVKSASITVLDASIKMAFKLFDANRKITASESQYRALVDGMPGIVYTFSNKRGGVFYSSSTKDILGYAPEQLLADPLLWQNSIHPDDLPRIKEGISNSVNGTPFKIGYRIHDAQGQWHWFEDRSFGARDNGTEVMIDGLALDITNLRQAEEEIQARDIRLRKLFANIPDLVYQFTRRPDGSYHVPIASQGIRNIFGCSPEDVLEDFEPIGRVIHPEDAARVIADIEYSAEHLSYFTCEFRVILPGKGIQWIYSRSSPERLSDGSVTWHGFNANITEKKLKEQEIARAKFVLQASIESPKDLIIMAIDRDYRYLCFNSAHSLAMKAAYGKEVEVGMNVLDCITSQTDLDNAKENYDRAFRGESHSTLQEYGDLQKTFFESHYNPIYNDKAEVIGVTAFARDITERKRAESELRESFDMLKLFVQNSPIYSFLKEVEPGQCRILVASENHVDMIGVPGSKMVGLTNEELFPPEIAAKITADDWSVASSDQIVMKNETLGERQYTTIKFPINMDGRRLLGGYSIDMTDNKLIEDALRESEAKYRTIYNNELYAISIFDLETLKLLDVNEAFERLYGYCRAELLSGMTIHDITAEQQASDKAIVQAIENGTISIPLRLHRKKDGTVFPVEIVGGSYEWKGRKVMFALAHDITERKRAEESLKREKYLSEQMLRFTEEMLLSGSAQVPFQKILDNLLFLTNAKYGGMTLLDESTGKFTTMAVAGVNEGIKKISKMLGFDLVGKEWPEYSTSNERLEGNTVSHFSCLSELAGRVLPDFITKPIEKLLDMGEITVTKVVVNSTMIGDFTLIMPAGKRFESDTLVEIYSRQINIFMTRVKAEETSKRLHDTNLELLRELQHRAKNSFTMISSMVAMTSSDAVSLETKKALDYLGTRINSVSELYSLLYSTGSFDDLQLEEYCARVARPLIALAGNISLKTELESVHVSVKNAATMGLIITELVTNAVKYAFPGGRRGSVTIRLKKIDAGHAILEVVDDGAGFPAGFDIEADAGMGLSLIKGLAKQIDGVFSIAKGIAGTSCSVEFGIDSK